MIFCCVGRICQNNQVYTLDPPRNAIRSSICQYLESYLMLVGFLPSIFHANGKTLMSPCTCQWRFMRPMYFYKYKEATRKEKHARKKKNKNKKALTSMKCDVMAVKEHAAAASRRDPDGWKPGHLSCSCASLPQLDSQTD